MMKPNFFIVGAPKCGTTALSEYLATHPRVYMSPIKEPQFFNQDMARHAKMNLKTYLSLFADADPSAHLAVGEASTGYLYSKCAIEGILRFDPEAKFIAMVRNPIDLARSCHSQMLFRGVEDIPDFERAWRVQADRAQGRRIPFFCFEPKALQYGEVGMLGDQVERLLAQVPRERTRIFFFDDFIKDPGAIYRQTLEFLGVPDDGRNSFPRINEAKSIKRKWLHPFLLVLIKSERLVISKLGIARKIQIFRDLLVWNASPPVKRELAPGFRRELADHFREDVEKLSRLTGRDLSGWLA